MEERVKELSKYRFETSLENLEKDFNGFLKFVSIILQGRQWMSVVEFKNLFPKMKSLDKKEQ